MPAGFRHWYALLLPLTLLLGGCNESMQSETEREMQKNYFLQSLVLVESAGSILQSPGLKPQQVEQALQKMDQGLRQAFLVEREFLHDLDLRLPRFYNELFIPGVEQYRLGVESSNREQQLEGLNLLSQWGDFWLKERPAIKSRLTSDTG